MSYRSDVVGSLLRPGYLTEARANLRATRAYGIFLYGALSNGCGPYPIKR